MTDTQWKQFFIRARTVLGEGATFAHLSTSWCAYTAFSALENGAQYWHMGLPPIDDIADDRILDGGLWRQSWRYSDLAHIVIPTHFYWETPAGLPFRSGRRSQDIHLLSKQLTEVQIPHRLTDLILEIKLY